MSMQHMSEATLGSYGAPHYPAVMRRLAEVYTAKVPTGISDALALEAAKACAGFENFLPGELTDDGYENRWIVEFVIGNGAIAIAMPAARDANRHDGVLLDRSPALYIEPNRGVTPERAVMVVRQLIAAMKAVS